MQAISSLLAGSASTQTSQYIVPPAAIAPATYHSWAHKHWVWLHHGDSNQANVTALVEGYKANNIPVGAVNIDSEWETYFNNFEVDTKKFSDFPALIEYLHGENLHVTMWTTSMVNTDSPDYQYCVDNNFLVRDGYGIVRPINWWKGSGALIDYTNPEAMKWWHGNMDKVLNVGIDGFKTDETDLYIAEYIAFSGAALGYNNYSYTYRDYANFYYRDFFYHTREVRGDQGLIMSRPMDCALDRITKVCTPSSPYDVMYSGWVGDDDPTFNGLTGCLRKVIYSAWNNYTNMGCDIGGYRGNSGTQDKQVFIRWAQLGAFLPLMENGGGGEHRPWMYDQETVDIYRKFVVEHYRLIPYMMTTGMTSMESHGTQSALHPLADKGSDTPIFLNPQPSTYSYLYGEDVLIHPVLNEKSFVEMTFPAGENDVWLSWWHPTSAKLAVHGQTTASTISTVVDLDSYPVYVRKGAMLPLQKSSEDETVMFSWFVPSIDTEKSVTIREPESVGSGMVGTASLSSDYKFEGTISAHASAVSGGGWEIIGVSNVASLSSTPEGACTSTYDNIKDVVSIYCSDISLGVKVTAEGMKPIM